MYRNKIFVFKVGSEVWFGVVKTNDFLETLRIQGSKMGLKTIIKKTKHFTAGINEGEDVILNSIKFVHVDSFTYLSCAIIKMVNAVRIKRRIEWSSWRVFFSQLSKAWKIWNGNLSTKIRILEATVMTAVKYCSKARVLRNTEGDLLNVSQWICQFSKLFLLTVYQAVRCTESVVQSHFKNYNERKARMARS